LISAGTKFFLLFVPGANLLSNCDASSQRLWRSRGIVRHEKIWRVFFRRSIQAGERGGMIEQHRMGRKKLKCGDAPLRLLAPRNSAIQSVRRNLAFPRLGQSRDEARRLRRGAVNSLAPSSHCHQGGFQTLLRTRGSRAEIIKPANTAPNAWRAGHDIWRISWFLGLGISAGTTLTCIRRQRVSIRSE
jgi:hypothetical protein